MESENQQRHEHVVEIEKIAACKSIFLNCYRNTGDLENSVKQFLEATAEFSVSKSSKLDGLTISLCGDIQWSELCQLYKLILSDASAEYEDLTYINWINCACYLIKSPAHSIQQRQEISLSAIGICEDALRLFGDDPIFAFHMADVLMQVSDDPDLGFENHERAENWFVRALMWSSEDDETCIALSEAGLLACFFKREMWTQYLDLYHRVNLENISEVFGEQKRVELSEWFCEAYSRKNV